MQNRVQPRLRPQHPLLRHVAARPLWHQLKKVFLDGLKICSAATPPTNQPNLPQKTNRLAQASAARVEAVKGVERAARATTAAVVNVVANHAEAAAKHAKNARATAKQTTVPSVQKEDADAAEVIALKDVVAKKLAQQKPPQTPWQGMRRSTPARPLIAHRAKKPKAAVVVGDVASAATRPPLTHKCHWQKMRLPTKQAVSSSKLCPRLRPRPAKAASASMSDVNDATVTAMAAIVRRAQKNPMTQTRQVWITLGRQPHLRLSQWLQVPQLRLRTACPPSPPTNCPWGSCSKLPQAAVWNG